MIWRDPSKFWQRIIVFICMLLACTLAAYTNASQFDETEIKLLTAIAGVLGVREVIGFLKDRK